MAYTLKIETVDKTSLVIAKTLSFSRLANHDDSMSCVLSTTAASYLPLEGQDIQVWDGTEFVFGGVIDTIGIEKVEAGYGSDKELRVSISSNGYKQICRRRTTTSTWQGKTAGYIIDSLITSILSGEGITKGSVSDGALIGDAEGYYAVVCKNCSEILDELAQASGMVWFIDGEKALNFYDFDTVITVPHELTEAVDRTFDDFDIESYTKDMSTYANRVFVRGGVGDDGLVVSTSESDSAEITARIAVEGGTGVYGYVLEDDNITVLADATTAATNYLKKSAVVPQTIVFTSYTLTYWYPGLRLLVNLPTLGISTDTYFVIEDVTYQDVDGKNLQVQIRATSRKGSDFSTQSNQTGIEYLSKVVSEAKKSGTTTNTAVDPDTGDIYPVTKGVVQVWVDTSMPKVAKEKDVLVAQGDYTRVQQKIISSNYSLLITDNEYIEALGTITITLFSPSLVTTVSEEIGVIFSEIKSINTVNGIVTITGLINGTTQSIYLYPDESVRLSCNGTTWRVLR